MSRKKRLERLEEDHAVPGEYPEATEKRRKEIRQQAEHENERFYRELARERRTAFLESVGYQGHTGEDLRDENFLYPGDEPPFTIAEDGTAFSIRDGRPITAYAQTLAEVWYWEFLDDFGEEGRPRKLLYDPDTAAFYKREPPYVMVFSRSWVPINRFFWAMGDERAYVSPREEIGVGRLDPERAQELIAASPGPYRGEG